jgi:ketosteroid isomerase-like protein
MKKLTLVLLSFLLGVTQLYSQDIGEIKAEINKMNAKFSKLIIEDDFDAMLNFYSDDIISMPSYQPIIRGVEEMKKQHASEQQSGVKITAFDLKSTDVIPAGDYFIEIGIYTITMVLPNMELPWDDHGKYLSVWKEDKDGQLKVKIETWNTDINPWMDMQKVEDGNDPGKPETMEEKKNEEVK